MFDRHYEGEGGVGLADMPRVFPQYGKSIWNVARPNESSCGCGDSAGGCKCGGSCGGDCGGGAGVATASTHSFPAGTREVGGSTLPDARTIDIAPLSAEDLQWLRELGFKWDPSSRSLHGGPRTSPKPQIAVRRTVWARPYRPPVRPQPTVVLRVVRTASIPMRVIPVIMIAALAFEVGMQVYLIHEESRDCQSDFPEHRECWELEFADYTMESMDACREWWRDVACGPHDRVEGKEEPLHKPHCAGTYMGKHANVKCSGRFVGSCICCECCEDDGYGPPRLGARCRPTEKFQGVMALPLAAGMPLRIKQQCRRECEMELMDEYPMGPPRDPDDPLNEEMERFLDECIERCIDDATDHFTNGR